MLDIIYANIFPDNVISGIATGFNSENLAMSYFETVEYSEDKVLWFRKLFENIFVDRKYKFYYQKQIHSDIIHEIKTDNITEDIESDAIITNKKGIILNVSVADCQAVLIYDKENEIISAVHSGWKGTINNIVGKTISTLVKNYNSNARNLLIFLPPSASVDNYEVGEEFLDYFKTNIIQIKNKYFFDNRSEIISQLIKSGCIINNIESNNDCTIANNRYHSYRRDKLKSGRMSAFIGLR